MNILGIIDYEQPILSQSSQENHEKVLVKIGFADCEEICRPISMKLAKTCPNLGIPGQIQLQNSKNLFSKISIYGGNFN